MAMWLLIAGIPHDSTGTTACSGSDSGSFKGAPGLVADHSACSSSKNSAGYGTALGVRAGRSGAIGKGEHGG
jgi:hypothetical protein